MQKTKRNRNTPLLELLAADREFIEGVMNAMPPVALDWARRLPPAKGAQVIQNAIQRTDGIVDERGLGYFGKSNLRTLVAAEVLLADVIDLHPGMLVVRSASPSAVSEIINVVRYGESADAAADTFFLRVATLRGGYFWVEDSPDVKKAIAAYLRSFTTTPANVG